MRIVLDDLSGPEIAAFLDDHFRDLGAASPPESRHALDLEGLRKPEITFWTAWEGDGLIGCGALKELDRRHAEIKSVRISPVHRQRGTGSLLVGHMIREAGERGYGRLSLETGSMDFFIPARKLYEKFGFAYCAPFSDYKEDPNSVFMTMVL